MKEGLALIGLGLLSIALTHDLTVAIFCVPAGIGYIACILKGVDLDA